VCLRVARGRCVRKRRARGCGRPCKGQRLTPGAPCCDNTQKHDPDWELIVERATAAGVEKMIGVSGSLEDSRQSVAAAKATGNIFATVGVHPTRCDEFDESGDPDAHLQALRALVRPSPPPPH
jgi:Tat protein secretion system quality control protein TatD with DNase activity